MKVTFLGTGTSQGVPVIGCDCEVCRSVDFRDKRLRTSVHIEAQGRSLVIDTGPDFRQQMLTANVQHVDAVLYTHEHRDHIAGMDDLRSFYFKQGSRPMPIYAREQTLEAIKGMYHYVFAEHRYPGVLEVDAHVIENKAFEVGGLEILPIDVLHYKLPVFGFRIGDFSYITDASYISDEELEKVKGSRVLALDALQHREHISHFTLQEAVEVAQKVGAERTYFIHVSHYMGLHQQVGESLPDRMSLAHDGLTLEL